MALALRVLVIFLAVACSGCRIWNPNKLYDLGKDYDYTEIEPNVTGEYRIAPGDKLEMQVYTNDAYKLVDAGLSGTEQVLGAAQTLTYLVDFNGVSRFPLIDTVTVRGLTVLEAARVLEERYDDHLVQPFVQLRVTNRRAVVHRGNDQGVVVPLTEENMTLMEVLGAAGGVPATGKAYEIKIIRQGREGVEISKVNLRDDLDLERGNIIVQANDIVVIESTLENTPLTQLAPVFALITSAVAVYALLINTRN